MNTSNRVYSMTFAKIYFLYLAKIEKKGRSKVELDEIIYWLTGYNKESLAILLNEGWDVQTFIKSSPSLNSRRKLIKGVVCGVRVEEVEEPLMREVRYLDKLVDELASGKSMGKILRSE